MISSQRISSPTGNALRIREGSYELSLAHGQAEIDRALRLRYRVFRTEMGKPGESDGLEFDDIDLTCKHLIVVLAGTHEVVGTYRINTLETAGSELGFYSAREFIIDDLPERILKEGIELGRACIAPEHRNSRVLFLMWKALMQYLYACRKRYFFGCCSIFTNDPAVGAVAYRQLLKGGHVEKKIFVKPLANRVDLVDETDAIEFELPNLFSLYLKLGAKVCSVPTYDREFGSIDFFVVLDTARISERYLRMLT